jgi:tetratricopeptide (TPR) repeat protein
MSDNYTPTETLIQYLDGELPQEQMAGLEAAIAANASLQEKLHHLRATREGVRMYGLRQQVQAIHAEMIPPSQTVTRQVEVHSGQPTIPARANGLGHPVRPARIAFMPRLMRVAAIVVFVLGMVTLYQYLRLSSANLFTESFHSFSLRETRGAGSTLGLKEAYSKGQTDLVLILFRQSPSPSLEDYFLTGNAFLDLDRPKDAIKCFQQVQKLNQQQQTHILGDDTEYYLAMSYLDNRQAALALPIFEKIHDDPAHLYHDKVGGWFVFKLHWLRQGQ